MTATEALREILRAVDAWNNDEPFEGKSDYEFGCDAEFLDYVGDLARSVLSSEVGVGQE